MSSRKDLEISPGDIDIYFKRMTTLQLMHNELRNDFTTIYEIVKECDFQDIRFKPLVRACYKQLFSLIEADIYSLNEFNPYNDYKEKDGFVSRFKKTIRQHANTFDKEELRLTFCSKDFQLLLQLRNVRDRVTHPKSLDCINVTQLDLENIKSLHEKYTLFIKNIMSNVFVKTTLPISWLFAE